MLTDTLMDNMNNNDNMLGIVLCEVYNLNVYGSV